MIEFARVLMVDILKSETICFDLRDHHYIDYTFDWCNYLKLLAVQVRYVYL